MSDHLCQLRNSFRYEYAIILALAAVLAVHVYMNYKNFRATCSVGFTKVTIYDTSELTCVRGDFTNVDWNN